MFFWYLDGINYPIRLLLKISLELTVKSLNYWNQDAIEVDPTAHISVATDEGCFEAKIGA